MTTAAQNTVTFSSGEHSVTLTEREVMNAAGADGTVRLDELKGATLRNLENLAHAKAAAADAFSEACKGVAEKAGLDAGVLKRYVTARVNDRLEKFRRESGQMELLVGELE